MDDPLAAAAVDADAPVDFSGPVVITDEDPIDLLVCVAEDVDVPSLVGCPPDEVVDHVNPRGRSVIADRGLLVP